ncbi:MAG: RHS repeat protein [Acidobacteria bacterium]|nr:RHS repeat protein [Acidobacteriota bacterium]
MRVSNRLNFSFTRACAFTLCFVLLVTSQPVALFKGVSFGQGLGLGNTAELRTKETPLKNLPDPNKSEEEKMKLGSFRIPEGTPATRCRHHDEKCKVDNKEKIGWWFGEQPLTSPQIAARRNDAASLTNLFRWDDSALIMDAGIGVSKYAKATTTTTTAALQALNDQQVMSARLDPKNRIGDSGEDLYSRNYNWQFPLVSLPGRAGMDLNLTLSYNSLIWAKRNGVMYFDPESSPITPGFSLGFPYFPKMANPILNLNNSRQVLWLLLPSGRSVELRDTTTAGLYESADSTYTQYNNATKTLTTSDGTRYYFPNGYVCTKITDRNGNFISITYVGTTNRIDTITDTANRVVKFTYHQTHNTVQSIALEIGVNTYRSLATFSYGTNTLAHNFSSLSVANAPVGQYPVLTRVTQYDGKYWDFYHSIYGQVYQFIQKAISTPTDMELVKLSYDVATTTTVPQSDCPRFVTRGLWSYEAMPGNSNWLSNSFEFNQGTACGNVTLPNGTVIQSNTLSCGTVISPDTLVRSKTYFQDDPNNKFRGLPLLTISYDMMTPKKYEQTMWEQSIVTDNYSYQSNPRVYETLILDSDGNKKRTAIKYRYDGATTDLPYNLPADVWEYDTNATTVLRAAITEYELSSSYTSRRILGLPKTVTLTDGRVGGTGFRITQSKVSYFYDGKDGATTVCSDCLAALPTNATQHDVAAYGTGFTVGRGNLTNIRIQNSINGFNYQENIIGYNITGSAVFSRDPLGNATRQTAIDYTDTYCTNLTGTCNAGETLPNKNTYAFPTKVTDPDGYYSMAAYDYHWGVVRKQTNPKSASIRSEYDAATGLLQRTTNEVNNGYTRYEYASNKTWMKTYVTVNDLTTANELMTTYCYDGFERNRAILTAHPGSSGGYKLKQVLFTARGQVWKDYDWAETNGNFNCFGDDIAGFCWTEYTYDWKERTKKIKNADGTTKEFEFAGCGCAGGTVTTAYDEGEEVLPATNPKTYTKRRRTKTFQDIFGRVVKTQSLNYDNSVYSTTLTYYDLTDRARSITQHQGDASAGASCPLATCQETDLLYDGYGRLQKLYLPIYQPNGVTPPYSYNATARAMTFDYNADNTLYQQTDPRGATTTYGYNKRGLVTSIAYGVPSGVAATPNVTFGYDELGNRTWMDDGPGRVDYLYDILEIA